MLSIFTLSYIISSSTQHVKARCFSSCLHLSATDSVRVEPTLPGPRVAMCNESHLQWEMEVCGEDFKRHMAEIDPQYWCNLTHFIRYGHLGTAGPRSNSSDCNHKEVRPMNQSAGNGPGVRIKHCHLWWRSFPDQSSQHFVVDVFSYYSYKCFSLE